RLWTRPPYDLIMPDIVPDDKFRNGFTSVGKIILNKERLRISELYFKIDIWIIFHNLIKLWYRMGGIPTPRLCNYNPMLRFGNTRYYIFHRIIRLKPLKPAVHSRPI